MEIKKLPQAIKLHNEISSLRKCVEELRTIISNDEMYSRLRRNYIATPSSGLTAIIFDENTADPRNTFKNKSATDVEVRVSNKLVYEWITKTLIPEYEKRIEELTHELKIL